jgi:hypothetical protein
MESGVRSTRSHARSTPLPTASRGSNARPRSSHAAIAPRACASATSRRASVVLPHDPSPRSVTCASRTSPPGPRIASRAGKPVGTTRSSSGASGSGGGGAGLGRGASAPSTGKDVGGGPSRFADLVANALPFPSRIAALPQRASSRARAVASDSGDRRGAPVEASEGRIGRIIARLMIERAFYLSMACGSSPLRPAPLGRHAACGMPAAPGRRDRFRRCAVRPPSAPGRAAADGPPPTRPASPSPGDAPRASATR